MRAVILSGTSAERLNNFFNNQFLFESSKQLILEFSSPYNKVESLFKSSLTWLSLATKESDHVLMW